MYRKIHYLEIPKYLERRLEKYLSRPPCSYKEVRDKLVFCLLYYQGFWVWVIRSLKITNYNSINKLLKFPLDSKHKKIGVILPEEPTIRLLDYIVRRSRIPNSPLIRSLKLDSPLNKPLSRRQIERISEDILKKLGFSRNIPPRVLRHHIAIRLTREKLTLPSLRKLIGPVSTQTFTNYKQKSGNFGEKGKI